MERAYPRHQDLSPVCARWRKPRARAGGGFNHRDSLSDAVLIKDNHLATIGLGAAVERARPRWPGRIIEVECDTLEQVKEAREAGVDIVMLDNMTAEQVHEAVNVLDSVCRVEVSGRISVDSVRSSPNQAPTSSPSARSRTRRDARHRSRHRLSSYDSLVLLAIDVGNTQTLRRPLQRRGTGGPLAHQDRRRTNLGRTGPDDPAVPRVPRVLLRQHGDRRLDLARSYPE